MKEASEVFKSIRYAKVVSKGKPHKSTDDEEHGTVGEKEYEDQVKHVKKMTGGMAEEVKDKYDEGEYDREGDMAKSDLRSIIANAQRLHDMMDDADNLPEWVQSKITLAEDYISTVANYLTSEMKEEVKDEYARKVDKYLRKKYNKEEVEYLEEKNAPTNPALWSRAKALARSKFDVYPSAYANGWASKWYKEKGGGWKSVAEAAEVGDDPVNQGTPEGLTKRGPKTVLKKFKELSEIIMPQVKNDLNTLDKNSFVKKHGLTKSVAKQKLATEAKEKTEYDYEGDMARGQLQSIISNAQRVHDMLEDNDNLPEWVQSKITLAEDYISTVANYMMSEIDEEVEQLEEGRPSQRHPLEGHEYHKKSDEALVHIAKDAHAAAEAMKSHNTDAENKYRDQANDSATVRHYRKTNGMPEWYKKKYGHMKEAFRPMDEPNYNNSIQARQKKADDNKPPFDGPYKKTSSIVTDKSGAKHGGMSIARHLAKQAAKKQAGSIKEEKQKSRKAQIIKDASRGKDKFEKDPIITDTTVKTDNLQ
jgi:hypothetical protein